MQLRFIETLRQRLGQLDRFVERLQGLGGAV